MNEELNTSMSQIQRQSALDAWTRTALGEHLIGLEQRLVDQILPRLYGFHLMQLGISSQTPLYANSMIRHRFSIAAQSGDGNVSAISELEQLPIESDSLDVMLVHHALEYSDRPHQLLREAARVVVPHGNLIVIGFNPLSLFGLRQLASSRFGGPIWQGQLFSAHRVADWLRLLDFGIDSIQFSGHSLPVQNPSILDRLGRVDELGLKWGLPGGASWMIHACKQVSPLTPVKSFRRPRAPRLAVPFPAASARHRTLH